MKRALLLAAPAVLALGLVACGDDDDDTPETTEPTATTSETGGDDTAPDLSIPEITVPDISIPDISLPDISLPDISIPDFSIPDFTIPEISLPAEAQGIVRQVLQQMFPRLDEDQIICLSQAFDGGTLDIERLQSIAEECNLDPADLNLAG
jgi:hypothetical protein